MKNNHINNQFEALNPDDSQKEKMWNAIEQQLPSAKPSNRVRFTSKRRKMLISLTACFMIFLLSATAYAALTDNLEKVYETIFKGKGQTVDFANGTNLHYEIDGNHTTVAVGSDGPWVVKKSWGRLIVTVNGEKINITKPLKEKGYFYYTYLDDKNLLHRLYIVKNAGGTKDYAERWYSQMEWLPEIGTAGGSRGISGPLGNAIMMAELFVKEDGEDLDTMLQKYLGEYWAEYGE